MSKSTRHVSRDLRKAAGSKKAVRDIDAQIGQRIREARQPQGMTQEVLANGLGITFRHSMDFASWKDRKSLAQALRTIYRAADAAAGQAALDAFAQGPWGTKYPAIAQSWRRNGTKPSSRTLTRNGLEEHQRVADIEWPVMPFRNLLQHRVGNRRHQVG